MSNAVKKLATSQLSNVADPKDVLVIKKTIGNTYEGITIIAKRANQISSSLKEELHGKLEEFGASNDSLEEVHENREQIEISRFYEKLPHPTLMATEEFYDDKIYHRNPAKEAPKSL
ncbi:MAG TPA: DNA-directed RNA polymerase subunit omega [Bacteroidetes bacterium]|nr:DNA-directed RNA polymerase subunit omega [Bacteroidota bacterium]